MIYSTTNIRFNDTKFINIESINDFIVMGYANLEMHHVNVTNSIFNQSFIKIERTLAKYIDHNEVILENCKFENIHSKIAIINDEWISCKVNIFNVDFIDINYGAIYLGAYEFGSSVQMTNVIISTSQLLNYVINSLFHFNVADNVYIENITAHYQYNINKTCYYDADQEHNIYKHIGSFISIQCDNPISLIVNWGSMVINNAKLSISITPSDITTYKEELYPDYDYILMKYSFDATYALITNYGDLTINNFNLFGLPFCIRVIHNYYLLNIAAFKVIVEESYNFDPNHLESKQIIFQSRETANIILRNSYFIGAEDHVYISGGSAIITDTIFEDGAGALEIWSGGNITVSQCSFNRIGRYWANIELASLSNALPILYIRSITGDLIIENSDFSGYDDVSRGVFMYIKWVYNITLRNNLFIVNASNLYYPMPLNTEWRAYGVLYFYKNYKISIYGNNFYKNDISPTTPWIRFSINPDIRPGQVWDGYDVNVAQTCLSANNFSNYAFYSYYNNITSCFRESLSFCINNTCNNGQYGNTNNQLFDKTSHFNIDINTNISSFLKTKTATDTYIHNNVQCMDNIQINIFNKNGEIETETEKRWTFIIPNISLLILDSVFPPNINILYNDALCRVVDNDRLMNDSTSIAKLRILCDDYSGNLTLKNIENTLSTNYVNHMSATQIHFTSITSTYFPGQKLRFDYQIFDKLNNPIHEMNYSEFIINLNNELLGLSQNIAIEQDGICEICDSGIIIAGVGLNNLLNYSHKLQTSMMNDNLFIINNKIELQITSCPIGYGPDSNKYQCHLCPSGTYNLLSNNTAECKLCHQDNNNNKGVRCYGGQIYVEKNHWLGFSENDNNNNMITELCPSWYCCNSDDDKESECNYNNQLSLCADGRDPSSPLCGGCLYGYSQSMNSTKCVICNENYYIWLFIPFLLSIVITLYLIKCHPKTDVDSLELSYKSGACCFGENIYFKLKKWFGNEYFVMLCKTLILRNILYYQQALSSILWPTSITAFTPYIYTISSLFNLEINIPNSETTEAWCFYMGLTTKQKILTALIPSLMTIILLLLMFAFIKLCHFLNCSNRNNTNYGKAFLSLWIICVAQLLSVSFKLLNYRHIGKNKIIHFYFGEEEWSLNSWTVLISIGFLIFVIIIFGAMFIELFRKTNKERQDRNYALNTFCKYYKPECYWWEFIILIRRISITLFAIFYTWTWYPIILICILLLFLAIHDEYQPFLINEANKIEYISLCCTIIVISIQTTTMYIDYNSINNNITPTILALFIIIPIFAIFLYILIISIRINEKPDKYKLYKTKSFSSMYVEPATMHKIYKIKKYSETEIKQKTTSFIDNNDDDGEEEEEKEERNDNDDIELQIIDTTQNAIDAPYNINDGALSIDTTEFDDIDNIRSPQFTYSKSGDKDDDATSPLCNKQTSIKSINSTHI